MILRTVPRSHLYQIGWFLASVFLLAGCSAPPVYQEFNPPATNAPQRVQITAPVVAMLPDAAVLPPRIRAMFPPRIRTNSIRFTWSTVSNCTYRLYWGDTGPRSYTHQLDADSNVAIVNFIAVQGQKLWAAVIAINAFGMSSDYSMEFVWPDMVGQFFTLSWSGPVPEIQSSPDLVHWSTFTNPPAGVTQIEFWNPGDPGTVYRVAGAATPLAFKRE